MLVCSLSGSVAVVFAQAKNLDIQFEHISDRDGLSQNGVYSILQDHHGLIWIATRDGLNRYDGRRFKTFYRDFDDPQTLPGNELVAIAEDANGRIWIASFREGIGALDPVTGKVQRLDSRIDQSGVKITAQTLYIDQRERIWIGGESGLFRALPSENRLQRIPGFDSHGGVSQVFEVVDKPGLWVVAGDGLYHFDPDREDAIAWKAAGVIHCAPDAKAGLWIGRYGSLAYLNNVERLVKTVTLPKALQQDPPRSMRVDHQGVLWAGFNGGLFIYDPQTERSVHLQQDNQNPRSLSHNNIETIFEDRSGIVWVGTFAKGISKYNRYSEIIAYLRRDPNEPPGVGFGSSYGLYEDRDGFVWSGSHRGVWRIDPSTHEITNFGHDPSDDAAYLGSVIAIVGGDDPHLWTGGYNGLARLDRHSGTIEKFRYRPGEPEFENYNVIIDMVRDEDGTLWLATYGGAAHFEPQTNTWRYFREEPFTPQLEAMSITRLGDTIWIGHAGGGLTKLDPKRESLFRYKPEPGVAGKLNMGNVLSLLGQGSDILWIGTVGGGLNRLHIPSGQFQSFTRKQGLANEKIFAMTMDANGHLWLATNRGIARFEPELERVTNFDMTYNLQANEYGKDAALTTRNGTVFLGGSNGVNIFQPDELVHSGYQPEVIFTGFTLLNQATDLPKDITYLNSLTLSHDALGLTFEFSALDYRVSARNTYAYQMRGLSEAWVPLGNRSSITFPSLEPGRYTLRIKGSNSEGQMSQNVASLNLFIQPPWWRHPFVLAAYVIVAFILIAAFMRVQGNKLQREREINAQLRQLDKMKADINRNLEAKVKERTEALRSYTEELETIDAIVRTINREMEPSGLLPTVLDQGVALLQHVIGGTLVMRAKNGDFTVETAGPFTPQQRQFTRSDICERLMSPNHRVREHCYIRPLRQVLGDQTPEVWVHGWVVSMPCFFDEQLEGFLAMLTLKDPEIFDEAWFNRLERFREHAVNALARARMRRDESERQRDLVETAHFVGMAENARRVLHHMGNHLNSLQTSVGIFDETLHDRGWIALADKIVARLEDTENLADFFSHDPIGQRFVPTLTRMFLRLKEREGMLRSELDRLDQQLRQILGMLREQETYSQTQATPETCDLNQLIQAIIVAEQHHDKNLEIRLELSNLPPVTITRMRFMHLISSLVKHGRASVLAAGRKQGILTICSYRSGDAAVISCHDNGLGIDPDLGDAVFSQSYARPDDDLGGELHNCANLVAEMSGSIQLKPSTDSGKPQAIEIHLPIIA